MPQANVPTWQTGGSPVRMKNTGNTTIPANRYAVIILQRGAGAMALPDSITSDEQDWISLVGASQHPVPAGEYGSFHGRNGGVVVLEASGTCTGGYQAAIWETEGGRVRNYGPLIAMTGIVRVVGRFLHDAEAGEFVEVLT